MKFIQICVLLMLCLSVKGYSKMIQCYTCDDCDVLDDCLLRTCPQTTTTTPSPTTTATTAPAPTPTPAPVPTPSPTSTFRTTITTATTKRPESSLPTTVESTSPSAATYDPTTEITKPTAGYPTTTENSISTEEPPKPTTDEPSSTSIPTEEPAKPPKLPVLRQANSYSDFLFHHTTVSYHCYSIEAVENNKRKKKRGCVEVPESKGACDVLRDQYGCSARNCKVCSEDRCNSSGTLNLYSLTVLIFIKVIGLFYK